MPATSSSSANAVGRPRRVFSAGGVAFRQTTAGVQIALCCTHSGYWVLPKGGIEPGESAEETAVREVMEETGLRTEVVAHLGDLRYRFSSGGGRFSKRVDHFLLQVVGGALQHNPGEHVECRWLPLDQARRIMRYADEVQMLSCVEDRLNELHPTASVRDAFHEAAG